MIERRKDIHTISMMVANKPGVLVRIALVFARRGYNIDSLVVSPSANPRFSRLTVTAKGDLETLEQIIKNVNKLIDVIHANEHNPANTVEHELSIIKLKETPALKTALGKLAKKYSIKILDKTDKYMIISQSGTTTQLDEIEEQLKKFGMVEIVRSGKLLLARGREQT